MLVGFLLAGILSVVVLLQLAKDASDTIAVEVVAVSIGFVVDAAVLMLVGFLLAGILSVVVLLEGGFPHVELI